MSGDAQAKAKEKSPQLTRKTVEHLATLSALSLTPDEADTMVRELGAIVGYIAELDELDTTDVPPTAVITASVRAASSTSAAAWRADVVIEGVAREEALAQGPRTGSDGFLVPSFVDATGAGGTTGTGGGAT